MNTISRSDTQRTNLESAIKEGRLNNPNRRLKYGPEVAVPASAVYLHDHNNARALELVTAVRVKTKDPNLAISVVLNDEVLIDQVPLDLCAEADGKTIVMWAGGLLLMPGDTFHVALAGGPAAVGVLREIIRAVG